MNFVFEDRSESLNFINCPDINTSGVKRFTPSPIVEILSRKVTNLRFNSYSMLLPKNYVISTGVNHHPNDWAKDSIFQYLNPKYLKDLQEGNAIIVIDQSLEGHQVSWLWHFFHKDCETYNIPPEAVVYITGNHLAPEQYSNWATENNVPHRIGVITYAHFEKDVYDMSNEHSIGNIFKEHVTYKSSNDIKTYNCLQKRLRPHRLWFYSELYQQGLLQDGLVSQNSFTQNQTWFDQMCLSKEEVDSCNTTLPSLVYGKNNNEHNDNYYIRRILKDVYLDSWVSVVSEVSYGNDSLSVFISEKTFKAIACCHPFIILGSQGSLQKLKDMGYRTFDGWIDESYDTMLPKDRFKAIARELKRIKDIPNKLEWFQSMEPIIKHNRKTFEDNSTRKDPAMVKLENFYRSYLSS